MHKLKKVIGLIMVVLCLFASVCMPVQANSPVEVVLNGASVAQGVIENERTLVPLRVLAEGLGCTVSWDGETQMVTVEKNDVKNTLVIGSVQATMQKGDTKNEIALDVAPCIIGDRTHVPLRYIAESLGSAVFWQSTDNGGRAIVAQASRFELEGVDFSSANLTMAQVQENFGNPYDTIGGADGVERLVYMRPENESIIVFGFCEGKLFEFFTNDTNLKSEGVLVLEKNAQFKTDETMYVFYDSLQGDVPVGFYMNVAGKFYSPYHSQNNKDAVMAQESKLAYYLTNALRRRAGVEDLVYSTALERVDAAHVASMAENHFFAHEGLNGDGIAQRMASQNLSYKRVGEILAKMPNAYYACYGWLNSKSHRENMLSSNYQYTGICVDGNLNENLYYAQVLLKK